MHHAFIDSYADLNTPLHRMNSVAKVICLFIFLLLVILSPIKQLGLFIFYWVVIFSLILASRVPIRFVLKKILEILPFIIIISLSLLFKQKGYILFLNCIVKAILAMLSILLISSTTKFHSLVHALSHLGVPKIIINLLSFMYRYSFLLEDEVLRTRRAYDSRNINGVSWFRKIRILSNILGVIFIHAYERAERVYLAMCARGYNNE